VSCLDPMHGSNQFRRKSRRVRFIFFVQNGSVSKSESKRPFFTAKSSKENSVTPFAGCPPSFRDRGYTTTEKHDSDAIGKPFATFRGYPPCGLAATTYSESFILTTGPHTAMSIGKIKRQDGRIVGSQT